MATTIASRIKAGMFISPQGIWPHAEVERVEPVGNKVAIYTADGRATIKRADQLVRTYTD
jgi:hypothetical protein